MNSGYIAVVESGSMFELLWTSNFGIEVLDEFETREEAEKMKAEYEQALHCSM